MVTGEVVGRFEKEKEDGVNVYMEDSSESRGVQEREGIEGRSVGFRI